jgi:hypothetical protein
MYPDLPFQIALAESAATAPIDIDVLVYVDSDPDSCGPNMQILASDKEGIEIFREFAAKMAAHYKSLK